MAVTLHDYQTLIAERRSQGLNYRTIAEQDFQEKISFAVVRLIGNGYAPGPKISAILGIPHSVTINVIGSEVIPNGAQAFSALECSCGQWFISNHPCRRRCFVCRPVRRRKTK